MKISLNHLGFLILSILMLLSGYWLGFKSLDNNILFQAKVRATYIAQDHQLESYDRKGEIIFGDHFLASHDIIASKSGVLAVQSLFEWRPFNSELIKKSVTRQFSGTVQNSLILDLPDEIRLNMYPVEIPNDTGKKLYLFYFRDIALLLIEKNRDHHKIN